uniref:Uncharacterized protein n=1 Tax=Heterorhabditis bacteriophora TaxID=37862 RepID=A0A1I7WTV2_HETBA
MGDCEDRFIFRFGVSAKSTADCKRADPTAIVVLHQSDLGEYLRNEIVRTVNCYLFLAISVMLLFLDFI